MTSSALTAEAPCVAIVSPHLDDACFSLGLTVELWASGGFSVKIINCYTISNYAPNCSHADAEAITKIRVEEDREFARRVGVHPTINLERLDAPLRLHCEPDAVCTERVLNEGDRSEIHELSQLLRPLLRQSCVVAPLSVGNHIDHRLSHLATIEAVPPDHPLGFYEDLPYSAGLDENGIESAVLTASRNCGRDLRAYITRHPDAALTKRDLICVFCSQFAQEDCLAMVEHAERYGGGERLWVDSNLWDRIADV